MMRRQSNSFSGKVGTNGLYFGRVDTLFQRWIGTNLTERQVNEQVEHLVAEIQKAYQLAILMTVTDEDLE